MSINHHILSLFVFGIAFANLVTADDSKISSSASHGLEFIAPEGRFAVRIELRQNDFDTIYDKHSDKQALGESLDKINLNSTVLPNLAVFGANASLGSTLFKADVKTKRIEFTLGYGVSDDLTLGVIIPYGKVTTYADFQIEGGNIGFNPAFNPALPPSNTNPPLLPVGFGPTSPVGTAGVQSILSDPAFGFAYKPLNTTSWEGLGDPTLGVLWRIFKSPIDSLIVGGGIRFGLADDTNPDDFLQQAIDDGTTDLRARVEYYRDLSYGFDFKLAAEYTYQSEDKVTRRIAAPNTMLALESSKESLYRKLGNYREIDLGIGKSLGDWRFSATWHRYVKSSDSYQSSVNTDTSTLAQNTGLYANQWRASASWSGIKAWQRGDLPLPLIIQLEVQKTYDAKNFPAVDDIYLQVTSFF